MSRRSRRGARMGVGKASIDMNSLIDLTFLLLVTFILTIPALEQGMSTTSCSSTTCPPRWTSWRTR